MKRRIMRKGVDRKVFKRTANRSRKINLQPTIMRGGYRL